MVLRQFLRLVLLAALLIPLPAGGQHLLRPAAPHYDVVALRVEFQPDTTRFTSGDGTFGGDLYAGLSPQVDPLPHDAAYFEAHLSFLHDYVARVSDGRTTVTTHLVPEVVRVSRRMGDYAPVGLEADSDAELVKLAALVDEAWALADAQGSLDVSGLDPATTAFVLFHAGVGRDVELIGTTLDKTPLDLPSLFFSQDALARLLGTAEVSYRGVPVVNTLVIPRTETRKGFNFITDEDFLAEFSINGLLAASFFNYLGVPDLFDTATGQSAIGPFGLMDALGIFAYNGLFPPEPSAWTKVYLGWAEPLDFAGGGPQTATLRSASDPASSDIARAYVSGAEYFLVENRYRDPEGDGLVMQVWKDGQVTEQRVQNGDEGFNGFNIDGFIGGVVVGVDNYDWALPGGVDEDDNPLNGGVLIWHVDERRLRDGLADNSVNADPERRAVDLEEADSAQDLGKPSGGLFGPQNDLGSPFDFWYEGNPVVVITLNGAEISLYRNRFADDTYPDSRSNEGGPSFIVLEGFTAPGPEMSVTYRLQAESGVTSVLSRKLDGAFGEGSFLAEPAALGSARRLLINAGKPGASPRQWIVDPDEGGAVLSEPRRTPPVRVNRASGGSAEIAWLKTVEGSTVFEFVAQNAFFEGGTFPSGRTLGVEPAGGLTPGDLTPGVPVVVQRGDSGGSMYVLMLGAELPQLLLAVDDLAGFTPVIGDVERLAGIGDQLVWVGRQQAQTQDDVHKWFYDLRGGGPLGQPAFGRDASGLVGVVPVPDQRRLLFLLADKSVLDIDLADRLGGGRGGGNPILADLDADGRLDALTTYGQWLVAFTQGGALVEGFPIRLNAPSTAQPLVAELSDSGAWSVVVAATDGYVYAYDLGRRSEPVAGFPLAVGASIRATPLLHEGRLYAVSEEGDLRGWVLDNLGEVWWGQRYANAQNQSYVELVADPGPGPTDAALLVPGETYNWPNPIRDGTTNLRLTPTRPCNVRITIIDAAGGLVEEIRIDGVPGGVPSEYRWETDAPSGLYYARIRARAEDGTEQTQLVRMAIIR